MEDVEQKALSSYPSPPSFWKRYVDDTLTALPQDQVQCFHEHLNSIKPTIQFTIERESTGTLPFWTPGSPFIVMGPCQVWCSERAHTLTSTWTLSHITPWRTRWQWPRLCSTMLKRFAQMSQTQRRRRSMLQRPSKTKGIPENWSPTSQLPPPEQDAPTATMTLPYIRQLSETIRRILAPLRIRTCFRPHHTLRQTLVKLKDQTPLQQRAGVIYQILCGTCSKVYIGQKGRTLEHRLKEHRRALASENTAQSAVAEHAVEQMHVINWNEAEVVACHPYYHQRCAL